MKKTILIAIALVVLGILICLGTMAYYDFDFSKFSTANYKTNTYEVLEDFDNISIDVQTTEIEFLPSDNSHCRVICREDEKVKHSVKVENGTLFIKVTDTRKWYEYIGINYGNEKITVYLPENQYNSLIIYTYTGDIDIPKVFSFEEIEIDGETSDVNCFASALKDMSITLSTGDIKIDGITALDLTLITDTGSITANCTAVENNIEINTATGDTKLTVVQCRKLNLESDTGDISLENVIAEDNFLIVSDTGDIKFKESDAQKISVETDTGEVLGSLLSDKIFFVKTDTGRISVPKTTSGGICQITTDTGDIKIEIEKGSD